MFPKNWPGPNIALPRSKIPQPQTLLGTPCSVSQRSNGLPSSPLRSVVCRAVVSMTSRA